MSLLRSVTQTLRLLALHQRCVAHPKLDSRFLRDLRGFEERIVYHINGNSVYGCFLHVDVELACNVKHEISHVCFTTG